MTGRAYPETVSELLDRRARKKAQTREQIRAIAHRLFDERGFDAVTIADVARQADVAVQTVFNHFATKEDLFFDGRVDWVDGPADAVRSRSPEVPPLTALREYLVELTGWLVGSLALEERRRYIATIEASDALRAQERENVFEAERRLQAALLEAWRDAPHTGEPLPGDAATAAAVTAAIWLSGARALVVEQRAQLAAGACPGELASRVQSVAAALLAQLEAASPLMLASAGRGQQAATRSVWPPVAQAG
jgi:AcrR family transcriptional regulator